MHDPMLRKLAFLLVVMYHTYPVRNASTHGRDEDDASRVAKSYHLATCSLCSE